MTEGLAWRQLEAVGQRRQPHERRDEVESRTPRLRQLIVWVASPERLEHQAEFLLKELAFRRCQSPRISVSEPVSVAEGEQCASDDTEEVQVTGMARAWTEIS